MRSITNENSRLHWKAFSEQEKVEKILSSEIKFTPFLSSDFYSSTFPQWDYKNKKTRARTQKFPVVEARMYVYMHLVAV